MNFDSEYLQVDWLSFNVAGSHNPHTIASSLSKYFRTHILIEGKFILIPQNLKKNLKFQSDIIAGLRVIAVNFGYKQQIIFF